MAKNYKSKRITLNADELLQLDIALDRFYHECEDDLKDNLNINEPDEFDIEVKTCLYEQLFKTEELYNKLGFNKTKNN